LKKKSICTAVPHILFHVQPFFSEEFTSTHFPASGQMISMCVCIIVSTEHNIQLPLSTDLATNTHKPTDDEGIHLVFVSLQIWYIHKHL